MSAPTIYHGTPLTPLSALQAMAGRAFCVSFYRPDNVEVVERIASTTMFRSWGIFILAGGDAGRNRMGSSQPIRLVDELLCVAGTAFIHRRTLGDHSRQSCGSIPDKRWPSKRLALWQIARRASLAHGWFDHEAGAVVRTIRPRLHRLDWRPEARTSWMRFISRQNGRSGGYVRQSMARLAYAAGDSGGLRLSVRQRGQHIACTKRPPLRFPDRSISRRSLAWKDGLCGLFGARQWSF